MIVHVASIDMLNSAASGVTDEQKSLMSKLCLGRLPSASQEFSLDVTTGGLDTGRSDWPSREAAEIIEAGVPPAAPSANLPGKTGAQRYSKMLSRGYGRQN